MAGTSLRKAVIRASVAAVFVLSTGCFHSIITTNLTPGTEVHHEAFKAAFIDGLVPATVDASSYCNGKRWARVETQYSFLNLLVGAVTFGIFTPMDIKVTCAA
jgi:hypothetical protein